MWDERYNIEEYVYGKKANSFLAAYVPHNRKGRALCLGEGEGRNGVFLAHQGFDVTGVDSSWAGLSKALRLAAEQKVSITATLADLASYNITPGSWDLIVSIFCHLPPEIRIPLHRQVVAGLKPGGLFILEAYTPDQRKHNTGGPRDLERLLTLEKLEKELEGLTLTLGIEKERNIQEGILHQGMSAVVQIIGVKKNH